MDVALDQSAESEISHHQKLDNQRSNQAKHNPQRTQKNQVHCQWGIEMRQTELTKGKASILKKGLLIVMNLWIMISKHGRRSPYCLIITASSSAVVRC